MVRFRVLHYSDLYTEKPVLLVCFPLVGRPATDLNLLLVHEWIADLSYTPYERMCDQWWTEKKNGAMAAMDCVLSGSLVSPSR